MPEPKRSGRRSRRLIAALMAGALVLSFAPGAAAIEKKVVKVAKGRNKWRPVHAYVKKPTKVIWRNNSKRVHDVKSIGSWSFNKTLQPGQQVARRFRKLGTFRYRCVRHSALVGGKCSGMCGFIHVVRG